MKKVLIIFSVALTLIISGALILATELSEWELYNLNDNVAQFDVKSINQDYTFDQLNSKDVHISNKMFIEDFFDDIDYSYFTDDYINEVIIVEDSNQAEGTMSFELKYLEDLGVRNCEIISSNSSYLQDNYNYQHRGYRYNRNNRHNNRTDSSDRFNKSTTVFPICNLKTTRLNLDKLKMIMKHKQLPIESHQLTVTINPIDRSKIID